MNEISEEPTEQTGTGRAIGPARREHNDPDAPDTYPASPEGSTRSIKSPAAHSLRQLAIQVPIDLPSCERLEEIYREECGKAAAARAKWLRFAEAARYLGISLRTFERKKDSAWGLPVSQPDGVKLVFIEDLDALLIANVVKSKAHNVIEFPSVRLHDAHRTNDNRGVA